MGQPVVHFEIGCRDQARTEEFFGKLFDWNIQRTGPASMIDTGGGGINGHITALGHEPHHYVNIYVQVDDLQAYLDKAVGLGGKAILPPMPIEGVGAIAMFQDPEGHCVGLFKR